MRDLFRCAARTGTRLVHSAVCDTSSGNGDRLPRKDRATRSVAGVLAALTLLAASGCGYTGDVEVESETTQAPPPPPPAAAEDATKPPARSAYGKAMEAAHRLEDKVDAYNKKLEQAADDAFK